MKSSSGNRSKFPYYLKPGPDPELLGWVGDFLRRARGKKTVSETANLARITPKEIENIEKGLILHNVGHFRQILRKGYDCSLDDVLAKCFDDFKERFNPSGRRRFERDYYYTFSPLDKDGLHRTPILIGGNPESFLWAVPLRKLKGQPLHMDFLELAPIRKKKGVGTPEISHDGTEIIHVINGSVQVHIEGESEGQFSRSLKHGESIHYRSSYVHQIMNESNVTSALLLIVRMPDVLGKE